MYKENTANAPRMKTDRFFADYNNEYRYTGILDETFQFVEREQLLRAELWARFVLQFREHADSKDAGWRGEFWGKMMRGASFVYSYTKNQTLYGVLVKTVCDMLDSADETGRISTFSVDREFDGWDLWDRKYVLLGMQYFLEICGDEALRERIVASMRAQVDYLIERIGSPKEGKKQITKATRHWRGLNSSSILEPVVRLYSITGDRKYFDFAEYIVGEGGTDVVNVFSLAYENELMPYQYPVTKAYEMTSCFEGLLEFYRVTGTEWYKTAVINFADRILENDFTVIGGCGCTHEFFDNSTVRQANTTNDRCQQETCVVVTMMKFFYQLALLTGEPKYVDAFEVSLYNAYLGSVNTEGQLPPSVVSDHPDWTHEPMPFDSYNPLTADVRGKMIAGLRRLSDNTYYGCCASIGSAGIGLVPKVQLMTTKAGFALNLFINGTAASKTPAGNEVVFATQTNYPADGSVKITLELSKPECFELLVRNPAWSKTTKLLVNGAETAAEQGYIRVEREWKTGDSIELCLDMRTKAVFPVAYGTQILMNRVIWGANYMIPTFDKEDPKAKHHIALRRGPVMLAQDTRLGYSLDRPICVQVSDDGCVDVQPAAINAFPTMIGAAVPLKNGSCLTVCDYASAGKIWNDEERSAVWMLTES